MTTNMQRWIGVIMHLKRLCTYLEQEYLFVVFEHIKKEVWNVTAISLFHFTVADLEVHLQADWSWNVKHCAFNEP